MRSKAEKHPDLDIVSLGDEFESGFQNKLPEKLPTKRDIHHQKEIRPDPEPRMESSSNSPLARRLP